MRMSDDHRTAFEKVVARLGLKRAECLYSLELRQWIKQHYQHRYVPEELLEAMGLKVFVT
jgi:hypothetical protein